MQKPVVKFQKTIEKPVVKYKQPETQLASPAVAPKGNEEAWTRATPGQTVVPSASGYGGGGRSGDNRTVNPSINRQMKFSGKKLGEGIVVQGINEAFTSLSSTAAFAEGLVNKPLGKLLGNEELYKDGPLYALNEWAKDVTEKNQKKYQANAAAGGKAAEIVNRYGSATVATVPQALAAVATVGGAATAKGLQVISSAAQKAPGMMTTLQSAVTGMKSNPNFWTSLLQTTGSGYEQAKADGADEVKATLYAIANGVANAAVEVGGGIQTLPAELRKGSSVLRTWIESMVEEGKEEAVQGAIERGLQNLVYQKGNPLISATDENAVLNPRTAAEEFAGGAVVGGILGGGQIMAGKALDGIQPRLTDENGSWYDAKGDKNYAGVSEQRQADFRQAEQIARNFGADFRVRQIENGAAGEYRAGTITISPTAENPVRQVLIHELTHHMETSGLYSQFSNRVLSFVAQDMNVDVEALKQSITKEYQANNVTLDSEEAARELVAKFAEEKLFRDEASIQRLLQTDRNLFRKVYDWIRDTIAKVRGTREEQFLIDAQRLYEKALRSAGEQAEGGVAQNAFGGVNARTADLNALETARQLERQGADTASIRRQTGWYRGMDGKWRFEIDDSGMRYRSGGDARFRQSERVDRGNTRLNDILQHNDLFQAYPELEKVRVIFADMDTRQGANYNPRTNTITVNSDMRDAPEGEIIHEVQHAIQGLEGFAKGTNREYWERRMVDDGYSRRWSGSYAEMMPSDLYRNTAGEIEARDAADRRKLTAEERSLKMPQLGDENTVFAEGVGTTLYMDTDEDAQQGQTRPYYDPAVGDIMLRDAEGQWKPRSSFIREEATRSVQMMGDRSPFSNGFNTRIAKDQTPLQAVQVQPGNIIYPTFGGRRTVIAAMDRARRAVKALETGPVTNDWTGLNIQMGKDFFSESATNTAKQKDPDSLRTLEAARELMGRACLIGAVETEIDSRSNLKKKNNPHRLFQYIFAAPYEMDGPKIAVLRVDVMENQGDAIHRAYNLRSIEYKKTPLDWVRGENLHTGFQDRATASEVYTISIADLVENIKEEYVGNHVNISPDTETGQFSMGRSFGELVQNQRDGVELGSDGQLSMRGFDAESSGADAIPQTLREVGVNPYGFVADYAAAESLAKQTSGLKTMRRKMQREIQKIGATAKERSFARQVASGQLTMEDVPATVDRNTVETLADYYYAMNSGEETMLLRERRNRILETEMEKMEPLLGMDVAYDERGLERWQAPGNGKLSRAVNTVRDSMAKNFSTFRRNLQTPARICEFEWGMEHGRKVYRALFQPVVENNGRQVTWMNNMLDGLRTFPDGKGVNRKLTKPERAVVQQMVENGAAAERVRNFREHLRGAVENVERGWTAENAAKEFGIRESDPEYKDLQNYAAYLQAQEAVSKSPDVDETIVDTAVQRYSVTYRKLYDAINTFLVAHGYDTIGFIQGYAPHLQPETAKTAFRKAMEMLGVNETAMDLPTSISGQTADLKPYKQFDPFFLERKGDLTDYDIVRGFEGYIQYLGNIFYHTDDIMRIRTAERYLRKTYTDEEASEMISWAENARNYSEGEKLDFLKEHAGLGDDAVLSYQDASRLLEEYITKLYDQVGSIARYGELAKYLNNYANRLAGKQSEMDRGVEHSLGRGALNWVNRLERKYGGAKIAFNFSSALNQTAQLPMVVTEAGERNTTVAMLDFLNMSEKGKADRAAFIQSSSFLKGKKGVDWITEPETFGEKLRANGFAMAEAVDGFTSYVAVRSKYLQSIRKGKSTAEAMSVADEFGRRTMGSRARGEKPMLFDTKNPFWQIATKFQLEVMNTWDHITKDLPNDIKRTARTDGKAAAARQLAARAARYEMYAFLLNTAARAVYGGSPAPFDVLGNALEGVADAMGLTVGETAKALLNNVLEAVLDGRRFEAEEDDENEKELDIGAGVKGFLGNTVNDIPLISRAAALLGIGDQTLPMADLSKVTDLGTSIGKNGLASADTAEAALNAASEFVYGGNQLRKTGQGLLAFGRGGVYSGDRLRYPVEQTPGNLVKGALFGKSSFGTAGEYYAHGSNSLPERMTSVYQCLVEEGVKGEVAYDMIQKVRAGESTAEQLRTVTDSLLTDDQKLMLYQNIVAGSTSKKPEEFRALMEQGLSWKQVADAYTVYLELDGNDTMKAGEKATRFASWTDRQMLTADQRAAIKESMVFYSPVKAAANLYTAMTGAGVGIDTAERLTLQLSRLRPEKGKEKVSNLQRYEVITGSVDLTPEDQMNALGSIMEASEFEKLQNAYAAGIDPGQYVEFKRATDGLTADTVSGKTVSGSRKAKVMAAINGMPITDYQKNALYYAAGYKESTLDDAPWFSGRSSGRSKEEVIALLRRKKEKEKPDVIMPRLSR